MKPPTSAPIARRLYLRELRAVYGTARPLARSPGPLDTPAKVAAYLAPLFRDLAHEHMGALYTDTQHRPICFRLISRGTLDATICHPRDVFQAALLCNAAAVHIAHNHPSGDTTPSREDRRMLASLQGAGDIIGIRVLSFFTIGADCWYDAVLDQGGTL